MRGFAMTAAILGTVSLAFATSTEVAGTTFASFRSVPFQRDVIAAKSDKDGGGKAGQMKSGSGPTGPQQFSPQQFKGPQPGPQLYKGGPKPQDFKAAPQPGPQQYQRVNPQFAPQSPPMKWVAPRKVPNDVRWVHGHRYYGAYFIVPFGASIYANHYCYDWFFGPYGQGYYWNYDRCPIYEDWW